MFTSCLLSLPPSQETSPQQQAGRVLWPSLPWWEQPEEMLSLFSVIFMEFLKPESLPLPFRAPIPTVVADLGKYKGKDKEREESLPQGEWGPRSASVGWRPAEPRSLWLQWGHRGQLFRKVRATPPLPTRPQMPLPCQMPGHKPW